MRRAPVHVAPCGASARPATSLAAADASSQRGGLRCLPPPRSYLDYYSIMGWSFVLSCPGYPHMAQLLPGAFKPTALQAAKLSPGSVSTWKLAPDWSRPAAGGGLHAVRACAALTARPGHAPGRAQLRSACCRRSLRSWTLQRSLARGASPRASFPRMPGHAGPQD